METKELIKEIRMTPNIITGWDEDEQLRSLPEYVQN